MTAPAGPTREIGIVIYPGVQMAAVHGLTDLFCIANRFAAEAQPDDGAALRITHWEPAQAGGSDISCVYRSDPRVAPQPRILILPPTLVSLPDQKTCTNIAHWLQRHHAQGVRLVSVCSGVFLVAETGLLDGRTVSTHRLCARALAESYPQVAVDTQTRMIDHTDILTAGGFMAWVDVALILVEGLLGGAVRAETARFVCFDQSTSEAPHFAGFVGSPQGRRDARLHAGPTRPFLARHSVRRGARWVDRPTRPDDGEVGGGPVHHARRLG
jgi:transcriptional regulator GlxA family with amidase domain